MFFETDLPSGKVLGETPRYHGPIFDVVTQQVQTPDDLTVTRDLIKHADAVAMLALTPDRQYALVNREYRVGVNAEVFALPAGLIDEHEGWEKAARRELEEETGFVPDAVQHMTTVRSSEGMLDESVHLVLAQIDPDHKVLTHFDADEYVMSFLVPMSELVAAVQQGAINSAQSVAAVTYYQAFLAN